MPEAVNHPSISAAVAAGTHRFCVAPMMDRTDRHCRYLHRLITQRARLYTEMITAAALAHASDISRFLDFDASEHPVALQLGGSDPRQMAAAARHGQSWGYDEINLNIGCPSPRVTVGRFGACLMSEPALVAECVRTMRDAVSVPVTVKTRIGVDTFDSDQFLDDFVGTVAAAGCDTFIIHARKAWLNGLSPKENREIPPLKYDRVARLKRSFPHLILIVNGGLTNLDAAHAVLTVNDSVLNGVMVGRAAYDTPYIMAGVDQLFYDDPHPAQSRTQIAEAYLGYAKKAALAGAKTHLMLRHISGLFHGLAGARVWRRTLAQTAQTGNGLSELVDLAHTLERGEPLAA